jgi:hypothetical protein
MKKILLLILFMLFPVAIFAANPFDGKPVYQFATFDDGTANSLDSVDGATLTGHETAFVRYDVGNYYTTTMYELIPDSGLAQDGINHIPPANNPGTKRWEIIQFPFCFGTVEPENDLSGALLWIDTSIQ